MNIPRSGEGWLEAALKERGLADLGGMTDEQRRALYARAAEIQDELDNREPEISVIESARAGEEANIRAQRSQTGIVTVPLYKPMTAKGKRHYLEKAGAKTPLQFLETTDDKIVWAGVFQNAGNIAEKVRTMYH